MVKKGLKTRTTNLYNSCLLVRLALMKIQNFKLGIAYYKLITTNFFTIHWIV